MGFFQKFKDGLSKTSQNLRAKIQDIFKPGPLTEDFLDELEAVLIESDVGVKAATELRQALQEEARRKPIRSQDDLYDILSEKICDIFQQVNARLKVSDQGPTVYILCGVNGSGKTTTLAKIAKRWIDQGKKVVAAASDTFRAAAEDQLEVWGKRMGMEVIAHKEGSDPGAVAFDAVRSAVARKADLVIVDTAGRLHTKKNLMEELKKIKRVIAREIPDAPHETLLVIDGTTGQNGLSQARVFLDNVEVTGICVTKLDGSSKGGVALAIARELKIPVKLLGMGEGMDDLRDFDARAFAMGLFGRET